MRIEGFSDLYNTSNEKTIKQIPENTTESFENMIQENTNTNPKFIPFSKDGFMSDNLLLQQMFAFFDAVLSPSDSPSSDNKTNLQEDPNPFNLKSLIGNDTGNVKLYTLDTMPPDLKNQMESAVYEVSRKVGIPKSLIYAIIDQESSFNPYTVNHNKDGTTDRGLMQVNYDHNIDLMKKYGITDKNQLFDIKTNILMGAEILKENFAKYGSWPLAIKAYNGINSNNWNYVQSVISKIKKYSNIG